MNLLKSKLKHIFAFIVIITLSAGLSSCNNKDNKEIKPDKIIDRETMIMLMADMDITEAALRVKQMGAGHDSMKKLSKRAYDSLYLYYKVTPELFKQNLRYYQNDMEEYEEMVDEKINLLTRKKDSISLQPEKLDTSKNLK